MRLFLTPDNQQVCDGLLTKTECEDASKFMNADKTPSTAAFQPNFTKPFGMTSLLIYSPPSILLTNLAACLLLKEGVSLNLFQTRHQKVYTGLP